MRWKLKSGRILKAPTLLLAVSLCLLLFRCSQMTAFGSTFIALFRCIADSLSFRLAYSRPGQLTLRVVSIWLQREQIMGR